MNRRIFVRDSLFALGALALTPRLSFAEVSVKPQRILIAGAGLAGLVSAYELKKLGHDVVVLEAQSRAGGRVHTLRDFADDQYADMGAARIPEDHDLTHKYVREFALELLPFYPETEKFSVFDRSGTRAVDWDQFARATGAVMGLEQPSHWKKIKGGNDLLPTAFASKLGSTIQYNSPVATIAQTDSGVTVKIYKNGKLEPIHGDLLICTIPATMLKTIEITPPLSDAKTNVIQRATYDSASRVFLQTKDRFWHQQKLNGFGFGEAADEVWDSTFGEKGSRGILQSYTRYLYSMGLTQAIPADRIDLTIKNLEKLYPGLRTNFERGHSKCWSEDPWVKGAWGHLNGQQQQVASKTEGRIYFAGEHLSAHPSWMQGALESGLRVVREIANVRPAISERIASNPRPVQLA